MDRTNRYLTIFLLILSGIAVAKFIVPGKSDRQRAIGSLSGLPAEMKKSFTDAGEFATIPDPGPHDWLGCHHEKGQTYNQYVRAKPNLPGGKRNKLYIQPMGKFDAEKSPSLTALKEFTDAYYYPMKVEVLPVITPLKVTSRMNGGYKQWLTRDLLDDLRKRLPVDAYSMLGITMTDLYPDPKWNFVFGKAMLRARVGVFSFARYHPSFHGQEDDSNKNEKTLVLKRSAKVLTHETGHMFGIHHCVHYHCNMNGANHLQEADATPMHLCPVCLRKLQYAVKFSPLARYKKLLAFYEKYGLKSEAEWVRKRMAFINSNGAGGQ